jgi:tetratricopeptide (TPR) repeat protein
MARFSAVAFPDLRHRILLLALVGAVAAPACAPATARVPQAPTPAEIPALQAAFTQDSTNIAVRFRLAEAYRRAGQPAAARLLLEPALATEPAAALYLGLVHEDLDQPGEARRLYQDYLARGRSTELIERVRDRLALLERLELFGAVRAALARERELAATAPTVGTIGVFPFLTVTDEPELRPLGTALAELLTTDLAQTDRLTVLERAQVQHLLDEIRLGESDRVDPATAARSGRILGAGNLLQGRVEGGAGEIALQAAVVRVAGDAMAGGPLRERDALARIFELEKRLALAVYEELGIQLTPAERERVTRQRTSNVQALLAFGYGLEAQDAGRYAEAAGHFVRALQFDAAFDLARSRYEEAVAFTRAEAANPSLLGRLGVLETGMVLEWQRWQQMFAPIEAAVPNPAVRDAAAEALGVEGPGRQGRAELVIRRPGGTP